MEMQRKKQENPSTYFVQDRGNQEERRRLELQGQLLTAGMGGVLAEQPEIRRFRRVLDVGCGTGEWLLNTAQRYPSLSLVGVDISSTMVEYARKQAEARGLTDRVAFHVMDALRMLEFPQGHFDLVNQRLGMSYLRTWDWPNLLQEYQRVTRLGGIIRVTEPEIVIESSSLTLAQLYELVLDAFFHAGHLFVRKSDGVTSRLAALLHQSGLQQVQTVEHVLRYHSETEEGRLLFEDIRHGFRTILPFLRKWAQVPHDYEALYQRVLAEMQLPDFVATCKLLTVWGIKCNLFSQH
jgi:ubiquinone/menaquinone biosynthesis C-methylase UbiE